MASGLSFISKITPHFSLAPLLEIPDKVCNTQLNTVVKLDIVDHRTDPSVSATLDEPCNNTCVHHSGPTEQGPHVHTSGGDLGTSPAQRKSTRE